MTSVLDGPLARAAITSLAATAFWIVLAWRSPTSTFHFAPFIVAVAGPYVARSSEAGLAPRGAALVATISAAIVFVAIALLAGAGRMQGPTFWSEGGAPLEAIIFAMVGAIAGFGLARQRR